MSDHAVLCRRSSGIVRLLRGWTIAVIAVLLAAGGHQTAHSVMHGATEAIPLQLLAFSAALTAPTAVVLAGRRISAWSTAATTILGQIIFHGLYSLPYTGVSNLPTGHDLHHLTPRVAAEPLGVQHAAHSTAAADIVMIAAHLLAAAMTVVVITHGERSFVTLADWLTLTQVRVVLATRPMSPVRTPTIPSAVHVWIPHPMNVAQTRTTRGPPVLA